MLKLKENKMTTKRIRETKANLLEEIDMCIQTIKDQATIIENLQTVQVNVQEQINQQVHLQKVFASIDISSKRVDLALNVLYPLNEMNIGTCHFVEEEVKAMANNVLQNELQKIAKQQLLELKQTSKVK